MDPLDFFVPGDPIALKRHRSFRMGKHLRQVDPSKGDKADFLTKAMANRPPAPLDEPLSVTFAFLFSRPKAHFRTGKNAHLLKDSAPLFHTKVPDADNLAKFVGDALNGIYWRDDSCIAQMQIEKRYADVPGVQISVKPAEELKIYHGG